MDETKASFYYAQRQKKNEIKGDQMDNNPKISNYQLKALIITTVIGTGILSLPNSVARELNNDGWIAILISGLISISVVVLLNKLTRLYPRKTYFEFGKEIIPAPLFNIISLITIAYFLVILAFEVRIFAEVMRAYLLEVTPTEFIIITMLLVTVYIARSDISTLGRMAVMIVPLIIIVTVIIVFAVLPKIDFINVLPLLRIDLKALPKAIFPTVFSYIGYEIIFVAMASVDEPNKSLGYCVRGIIFVMAIYLLTFFITLSEFGIHELKRQVWPSITLMREVDLPGFFIENIDAIIMTLWILVIFGTMGPIMYASGVALSKVFNTKKHDFFILPLVPIIYLLSLIPENLSKTYMYTGKIINYFAIFVIFIFPLGLYIISLLKRKGKGGRA